MITISKRYTFDSAHRLCYDETEPEHKSEQDFGKCGRLHGHTYILTVVVTGRVSPSTGMVMNYFDLDKVVKPYIDNVLDHRYLNRVWPNLLTTAENLVTWIAQDLQRRLVGAEPAVALYEVKLQETPKTSAVWRNDAVV